MAFLLLFIPAYGIGLVTVARERVHWAVRKGATWRLRWFLFVRPGFVNTKGDSRWTPLHRAAAHGQKEVAGLLLAKGADVNALVPSLEKMLPARQITPLDVALRRKHKTVAELLCRHGGKTGDELKRAGKEGKASPAPRRQTDRQLPPPARRHRRERARPRLPWRLLRRLAGDEARRL